MAMKIWAYIVLAGILIGFVKWAHSAVYDAGYNARDTELRDDAIEQQNTEIDRRMAEWIETQSVAEAEIIVEEKIVTEIQYVDREITKTVTEIVEVVPECRDLGDGYSGLLNKQVRASNQGSDPSPAITPALANPL